MHVYIYIYTYIHAYMHWDIRYPTQKLGHCLKLWGPKSLKSDLHQCSGTTRTCTFQRRSRGRRETWTVWALSQQPCWSAGNCQWLLNGYCFGVSFYYIHISWKAVSVGDDIPFFVGAMWKKWMFIKPLNQRQRRKTWITWNIGKTWQLLYSLYSISI